MPAASYEYIEAQGLIVADTDDLISDVELEWLTAFGADLVTTADTPQGVMIVGETSARTAVMQNNATVANQINPNLAGGVFLDAICAWLFIEREAESFTQVAGVAVAGQPNIPIPAGSRAKTAAGDIFQTTGDVTLSPAGTGTVNFIATAGGPVPCPPGALNQVVDMVFGWETVSSAGITPLLGAAEQSDASLRTTRNNSLAILGKATPEAIQSALTQTAGVTSFKFRENYTNVPAVIDGIPLVANSVWACVAGGTDLDVATALLSAKGAGANWNGAVTVPIVSPISGQTYNISFDRPTLVPVIYRVTMRQGTYTGDLTTVVPQAVEDYTNGLINSDPGFVVGGQVSPFDVVGGIYTEAPGSMVSKVEVAPVSTGIFQTTEIPVALNQEAQTNASSVVVLIVS